MKRTLELWVAMKLGELKTDRVLTMEDFAEIEARHPIMIGNVISAGRLELPRRRKQRKRHGVAKRARRRSARRR
jgi:hypothetical protein